MTTRVRTDELIDPPGAEAIAIEPLTGRIGAEIVGLDLSRDLSDVIIAAVREALLTHRVVFFRDQNLDMARQTTFAERFGPLTVGHPTLPGPDHFPQVVEFDALHGAGADHWHTDVTFVDRPPTFSVLPSVVIPATEGTPYGPTQWPPMKICRSPSSASSTDCGPSIPIPTTTPTLDTPLTRPAVGISKCSRPPSSRPNTRWCGSTPRRVNGPFCWAASPTDWSGYRPTSRETCSTCWPTASPAPKTPSGGGSHPHRDRRPSEQGARRRCHDIQRHRGGLRNPWPPARAAAGAAADRTSGTEQRTDQLAEGGHLIAHLRHRPGRETELEMGAAESGELGQVLGDLLR